MQQPAAPQEELTSALAYIHQNRPLVATWVEKQPIDHRRFNWRFNRKWMELYPHLVVWYRDQGSVPRGYLMLAATTTVQVAPGKRSAIEVVSASGRTLRFRLPDPQSHHAWLSAIQGVLFERRNELTQQMRPPPLTPSLASHGGSSFFGSAPGSQASGHANSGGSGGGGSPGPLATFDEDDDDYDADDDFSMNVGRRLEEAVDISHAMPPPLPQSAFAPAVASREDSFRSGDSPAARPRPSLRGPNSPPSDRPRLSVGFAVSQADAPSRERPLQRRAHEEQQRRARETEQQQQQEEEEDEDDEHAYAASQPPPLPPRPHELPEHEWRPPHQPAPQARQATPRQAGGADGSAREVEQARRLSHTNQSAMTPMQMLAAARGSRASLQGASDPRWGSPHASRLEGIASDDEDEDESDAEDAVQKWAMAQRTRRNTADDPERSRGAAAQQQPLGPPAASNAGALADRLADRLARSRLAGDGRGGMAGAHDGPPSAAPLAPPARANQPPANGTRRWSADEDATSDEDDEDDEDEGRDRVHSQLVRPSLGRAPPPPVRTASTEDEDGSDFDNDDDDDDSSMSPPRGNSGGGGATHAPAARLAAPARPAAPVAAPPAAAATDGGAASDPMSAWLAQQREKRASRAAAIGIGGLSSKSIVSGAAPGSMAAAPAGKHQQQAAAVADRTAETGLASSAALSLGTVQTGLSVTGREETTAVPPRSPSPTAIVL